MELVLAFAIGWAAGARGGEKGFREVVDAAQELRRSEEFGALMGALRSHLAASLRVLAEVVAEPVAPDDSGSVVERVVRLTRRAGPTSSAS